jgi:YfiH family protein
VGFGIGDSGLALPQPSDEFEWVQASWGPALRCRAIHTPHVFTTRGLELRHNEEAWLRLAAELGVDGRHIFRPKQVHGDAVVVVPSSGAKGSGCESAADIIMTRDADAAVAVQAADCVPLLFFDAASGAVAAAHAGWRGTAAGVARSTIRAMNLHFGTRPDDFVVAIGPSIGPCCYCVGEELIGAFGPEGRRWFYHLAGGWMLNLWDANRDQLVETGVRSENVHVAELCTAMHPELFDSYRRDGKHAGRLAAAIKGVPAKKQ